MESTGYSASGWFISIDQLITPYLCEWFQEEGGGGGINLQKTFDTPSHHPRARPKPVTQSHDLSRCSEEEEEEEDDDSDFISTFGRIV